MVGSLPACCAPAASGQAAGDPTITLMKSRRRIAFTKARTTPNRTRLQQGFTPGGMGSDRHLRGNNPQGRMSALGGGFNRSTQHLLILPEEEVCDGGDCTDMVH